MRRPDAEEDHSEAEEDRPDAAGDHLDTTTSFDASLYQKTRDSKHFLFIVQRLLMETQKHPFLNILSSLLMYAFMFAQDLVIPFYHADTRPDTNTQVNGLDVVCYILGLTPYHRHAEDLTYGMNFCIIVCLFCFFSVLICFGIPELYGNMCIKATAFWCFYVMPILVVPVIDCFERGYNEFTNDTSRYIFYIGYFLHIGFVAWFIVVACFFSSSGFVVNHVYVARSPVRGLVVIGHMLWVSNMRGVTFPFNRIVMAASCGVNIAVLLFYLADPPFYSGLFNCIADAFCFYHVMVDIYWLVADYDKKMSYILLAPAFGASILINFVVYPFCIRGNRQLLFAFISSRKTLCLELLQKFDCDHASNEDLWNAVIISLYFRIKVTTRWLERCTIELRTSLDQVFRFWTAMNLYQMNQGELPDSYVVLFMKWIADLEKAEKEFWHHAWLSDCSTLPRLAASVGRKRMLIAHNVVDLDDRNLHLSFKLPPSVEAILPETKREAKCPRSRVICGGNEIILITTIVTLIGLLGLNLWVSIHSRGYTDVVNYLFGLTNFNFDWVRGYDGPEDLPAVHQGWVLQVEYLDSLKGDSSYGFLEQILSAPTSYGISTRDGMEMMVDALANATTNFPIETYYQFAQAFDEALVFLHSWFFEGYGILHKNIVNYSLVPIGALWLIAVLYMFINSCVRWRKQKQKSKLFRLIDHKVFFDFGAGFDDEEDPLYVFPVEEKVGYVRSFPLTAVYNCWFFVVMSVFLGMAVSFRAGGLLDIDRIEMALTGIGDVNHIVLWFYVGTMAHYGGNPTLYSSAWKLASANIVEVMFRGQVVSEFLLLYNDSLSAIIGESLLAGKNLLSTNETYDLASQFYADGITKITQQSELYSLYERNFLFRLMYVLICGCVMTFIMIKLRFLSLAELESLQVLHKQANNANDGSDSFELEETEERQVAETSSKFKIENLPVPLILVDEKLKVKKATRMACQNLQIKIGRPLLDSSVTVKTLDFVINAIAKYKQTLSEEVTYVGTEGDGTDFLVLRPIYEFVNNHLEFKEVMGIFIKNYSLNSKKTTDMLHQVFYQIYPPLVEQTQTFPYTIKPSGKKSIIIMIKLMNFHQWAGESAPELVESYRQSISELVANHDNTVFFKVRETGDQIMLVFNGRNTSVSQWKILENGAALVKDALKGILAISKQYENNIVGRAIILKCPEPGYFFSDVKASLMDITTDYAIIAEQYQQRTLEQTIGYATYKNEPKVPNTTVYKSCYTACGNKYELLIFV